MAKKTSKPVTKKSSLESLPVVVPQNGMPQELRLIHDRDERDRLNTDLLSVALAQGEELMQQRLAAALEAHKVAQVGVGAKMQEVSRKLVEIGREKAADSLEELKASALMAAWQLPRTISCTAAVQRPAYNEEAKRWTQMLVTLHFVGRQGRPMWKLDTQYKPPLDLVTLLREQGKFQKQADAAQGEAMEWKRKMSNLPKLERRHRARLAADRISKREDSQGALEMLLGTVEADIQSL